MREFDSCLNSLFWLVSRAELPLFRANPRRALGLHYVVGMDCGFYHDGWLHNDDHPRPPTLAKDLRQIDEGCRMVVTCFTDLRVELANLRLAARLLIDPREKTAAAPWSSCFVQA